jgi:hypothetical protein
LLEKLTDSAALECEGRVLQKSAIERDNRAKLNVENAELWNAVSTMLVMPLIATFGLALGNQSANRSFLKLATQINHCG